MPHAACHLHYWIYYSPVQRRAKKITPTAGIFFSKRAESSTRNKKQSCNSAYNDVNAHLLMSCNLRSLCLTASQTCIWIIKEKYNQIKKKKKAKFN